MRVAALVVSLFSLVSFGEIIIDPPSSGPRKIVNAELGSQPKGHAADDKHDVHYHDSSAKIENAILEVSDNGIVTLSALTVKVNFKRVEAITQREDKVVVATIKSKVTVIDDPGVWTITLKDPVVLSGVDLAKYKIASDGKVMKLVPAEGELSLKEALNKALAHDNQDEAFGKLFTFKAQGNYDGGVFDGDKKTCLAITERDRARLSAPFINSAIEYLGNPERLTALQATSGLMPDSLKRDQDKFSIHLKDSRMVVLLKDEGLTVALAQADARPSLVMSAKAASELVASYLKAIPDSRLPANFSREGESGLVYKLSGLEQEEMSALNESKDQMAVSLDANKLTLAFESTAGEDKAMAHFLVLRTGNLTARYSAQDLRFVDVRREGQSESRTVKSEGLLRKHFSSMLKFALLGTKARPRIDNPNTFSLRFFASEDARPDTFGDEASESQLLEIFAR